MQASGLVSDNRADRQADDEEHMVDALQNVLQPGRNSLSPESPYDPKNERLRA